MHVPRKLHGYRKVVVAVDRFYIALFSALEQTHCARIEYRFASPSCNLTKYPDYTSICITQSAPNLVMDEDNTSMVQPEAA